MHSVYVKLSNDEKYFLISIDGVVKNLPATDNVFSRYSARLKLYILSKFLLENNLPIAQYIASYYHCRGENYLCVVFDIKEMERQLLGRALKNNYDIKYALPCIERIMANA